MSHSLGNSHRTIEFSCTGGLGNQSKLLQNILHPWLLPPSTPPLNVLPAPDRLRSSPVPRLPPEHPALPLFLDFAVNDTRTCLLGVC